MILSLYSVTHSTPDNTALTYRQQNVTKERETFFLTLPRPAVASGGRKRHSPRTWGSQWHHQYPRELPWHLAKWSSSMPGSQLQCHFNMWGHSTAVVKIFARNIGRGLHFLYLRSWWNWDIDANVLPYSSSGWRSLRKFQVLTTSADDTG